MLIWTSVAAPRLVLEGVRLRGRHGMRMTTDAQLSAYARVEAAPPAQHAVRAEGFVPGPYRGPLQAT